MNREHDFAEFHAWWMWKRPDVLDAVVAADVEHFSRAILVHLESNARGGLFPSKQAHLALPELMDRKEGNISKMIKGSSSIDRQLALGILVALGLTPSCIIRAADDWLTEATQILCKDEVTLHHARAYALYRLAIATVEKDKPLLKEQDVDELQHLRDGAMRLALELYSREEYQREKKLNPITLGDFKKAVQNVMGILELELRRIHKEK